MREVPDQLPQSGNRFLASFGEFVLKITGWKIKGDLPNHPKLVIAVAPHTTNWDFVIGVAVLFALRIRIRFLGKHTLFFPGFKQFLEWLGGIPVKRDKAHGVVDQVTEKFNKNERMILALSPEGTRSKIFPWKTGFLAIAQKSKVPVVLIDFDYKFKEVVIQPPFELTRDINSHMQDVYAHFKTVHGKYPEKCVTGSEKE